MAKKKQEKKPRPTSLRAKKYEVVNSDKVLLIVKEENFPDKAPVLDILLEDNLATYLAVLINSDRIKNKIKDKQKKSRKNKDEKS